MQSDKNNQEHDVIRYSRIHLTDQVRERTFTRKRPRPHLQSVSFQPPTLLRPLGPSPSPVPSSMRSSLYLAVAAVPALAAIKDVFWDITYVDNVNPDGLSERRAIGVNGTWP